jgi:hypothetical protein
MDPTRTRLPLVIILMMGGVIFWQLTRIKGLQSEIEAARSATIKQAQRQQQIRDVVHTLSAPDEIIMCDIDTTFRVARIRQQAWGEEGRRDFTPFTGIAEGAEAQEAGAGPLVWPKAPLADAERDCYEAYILSRVSTVCDALALEMKENVRLGAFFKTDKKAFDERIRPRALRLLGARVDTVVLSACRLLLAAGDRSEAVLTALASVKAPYRADAAKLAKEYGLPALPATRPTSSMPATGPSR